MTDGQKELEYQERRLKGTPLVRVPLPLAGIPEGVVGRMGRLFFYAGTVYATVEHVPTGRTFTVLADDLEPVYALEVPADVVNHVLDALDVAATLPDHGSPDPGNGVYTLDRWRDARAWILGAHDRLAQSTAGTEWAGPGLTVDQEGGAS